MSDRRVFNPTNSQFHHSRAIQAGGFVFLAGHVARENGTGDIKGDGVAEQTEEIFRQFGAALALAGSSLDKLVKVTVYLTKKDDFPHFDAAYKKHFTVPPPARTTIIAELLPPRALIEIEGIAIA